MRYPLTGNDTDDVETWSHRLSQQYNMDAYVVDGEKENAFLNFQPRGMKQPYTSWKMHISATTPQALEALVELASFYKLPHVKVAASRHLELFTNPQRRQRGKAATFYHFEKNVFNQTIDWQAVAYAAEAIVATYGGPGSEVRWDHKVSDTIFYRNDLDIDGKQMKTRNIEQYLIDHDIPMERAYNLGNRPDPWENLKIQGGLKNLRSLSTEILAALRKFQQDPPAHR